MDHIKGFYCQLLGAYDCTTEVEHSTNNFVESFNDWIEDFYFKPPIALLKGICMQQTDIMYTCKKTIKR